MYLRSFTLLEIIYKFEEMNLNRNNGRKIITTVLRVNNKV